ncbi:hypothetical protein BJ742DRAFT_834903 [Cladochytrium replicatum]|nr:hypothetical protein BJ742DRAFT_834903 [Cladochytrium replicatum]
METLLPLGTLHQSPTQAENVEKPVSDTSQAQRNAQQPSSGGPKRGQRSSSTKACDRCYNRKVRCFGGGTDEQEASCRSCLEAGVACTYGNREHRIRQKRAAASTSISQSSTAPTESSEGTISTPAGVISLLEHLGINQSASSETSFTAMLLQHLGNLAANSIGTESLNSSQRMDLNTAGHLGVPARSASDTSLESLLPLAPISQLLPTERSNATPYYSIGSTLPYGISNLQGGQSLELPALFTRTAAHIAVASLPSPIHQSPTPVVESPISLLSPRQKDELIDAYFNFINPMFPFLHPSHFWNEYRNGRVPEFLLDVIFGAATRYMDPRVKIADSLGVSLNALSQSEVGRDGEPWVSCPEPSLDASSRSHGNPLVSQSSWADVSLEQYVLLKQLIHDRAIEWVRRLTFRQASLSLVHAMFILTIMELGRPNEKIDEFSILETAIRLATQINLNVDQPGKPFEVNIKRRTWWCLAMLETSWSFMYGAESNLPSIFCPSFPEVNPTDGSGIGVWSPEATRAFIASADLARLMTLHMRTSEVIGTHEYLDTMRQWEAYHGPALRPPQRANPTLLHPNNIYSWVLTASANIIKHSAIIVCLRPAALAFQIGAEDSQDWSMFIRHEVAKNFRPSYGAWIATHNAAHALCEIMETTPNRVLPRIPLLLFLGFPAVTMCFQSILHMSDPAITSQSAKMLSKLCQGMAAANPWEMGLMYDSIAEFCLRFANLYRLNVPRSLYCAIIEKSNESEPPSLVVSTIVDPESNLEVFSHDSAQPILVTTIGVENPTNPEPSLECPPTNNFDDVTYGCDSLFMDDPPLGPLQREDWGKSSLGVAITPGDFMEVQTSLMGTTLEIMVWIFRHLDFPKEMYE